MNNNLAIIQNQNLSRIRDIQNADELEVLKKQLIMIADMYTGANISSPLNSKDQVLFQACINEIKIHHSNLNVHDIKNAFSLASAGKLDVKLITYFGKFTISLLMNVLNSYKQYKSIVLNEHYEKIEQDEKRKNYFNEICEVKAKNTKAKFIYINQYLDLKNNYTNEKDLRINIRMYKVLKDLKIIEDYKSISLIRKSIKLCRSQLLEKIRSGSLSINHFKKNWMQGKYKTMVLSEYQRQVLIKNILD